MLLSRLLLFSLVAVSTTAVRAVSTSDLARVITMIAPWVSDHDMVRFLAQWDTAAPPSPPGRRALQTSAALDITLPASLTGDKVKPEAHNGWINTRSWRTFDSSITRRDDSAIVKLSYVTARNSSGTRGGVIISVGHTEPVEKYAEQIHDLLGQGFSPVYALDHRGQGRSTRLLPDDSFKSHVESAANFIADFRAFVSLADAEMKASGEGAGKRFLHCHSMGCAIALTFLLEEHYAESDTVFNAVAANAPLIKPNTDPFPYGVATAIGNLMLLLNLHTYYPPTKGKSFEELYVDTTAKPDRQRIQTARCIARRDTAYTAGHTGLCLGDVTALFAAEFFGMFDAFESFKTYASDYQKKLSTPILIQQAKDVGDGSDGIVINTEHDTFCNTAAEKCTVIKHDRSEHNIWFETDSIRSKALNEVYSFYDANAGIKAPQTPLAPTCQGAMYRAWCRVWPWCSCIADCSHPAARC